ncbi:MAG: D-glycero-beta-D-manno-heptose 1-phosphate adenylyltransferase, partial [Planctomycetes bacterium]|nr:D-glycero-beta-D-manno-heptose 1-phosphate adenylyltransferase [Planctomycetota bacterium]
VTLDSDGIALVLKEGAAEMLPTRKRHVYDITGAGDMVLAMIGVGTAAGIAPEDVARLANVAGGLEVEQIGVVTISRDEILADLMTTSRGTKAKVCSRDELSRHVAARKRLGQRVVLTNGCFDLLHVGHVSFLEQAAREGDCLIVAVNSDDGIRRLGKGPDRPLFDESQRTAMLAALESVDYVVIFDEPTPHALLEVLQPDVLVKGGTYAAAEIVGREVVHAYGGEAKVLGITPGVSTTEIVQRLRNETVADSAKESISAASFVTDAPLALDSRLSTLDSPNETRRKAG